MKITVTIETTQHGVMCRADFDGGGGLAPPDVNLYAIGALEIAKAGLLARRWGVNIGNVASEPPPDLNPVKA